MFYAGISTSGEFVFWIIGLIALLIPLLLAFTGGYLLGKLRARYNCCKNGGAQRIFRRLENYVEEEVVDEDGFTGLVLTAGNWRNARECD